MKKLTTILILTAALTTGSASATAAPEVPAHIATVSFESSTNGFGK